jgi:hypothetical protein
MAVSITLDGLTMWIPKREELQFLWGILIGKEEGERRSALTRRSNNGSDAVRQVRYFKRWQSGEKKAPPTIYPGLTNQ